VVRLSAVGETNEEGEVRVFFELNGQPRTIRVPNRKIAASQAKRPKAEAATQPYRRAHARRRGHGRGEQWPEGGKQGDLLLTIEAMKMETGIHAERDATVKAVHVAAGGQIDAKDLLVELDD
jgi:pyruvate carboxylase